MANAYADLTRETARREIAPTHKPKERGILFSAPMVRAILDGGKTVTRRIVKPQGPTEADVRARCGTGYHYFTDHHAPSAAHFRVAGPVSVVRDLGGPTELRCPYGKPGDRLWVRETWARLTGNGHRIVYRADGEDPRTGWDDVPAERRPKMRWTPAIHLCRVDSRITLDVIDVRVERLHDITEEDAAREGVTPAPFCKAGRSDGMEHVEAFEDLWSTINGASSWAANPWVWRVEFRVLDSGPVAPEGK